MRLPRLPDLLTTANLCCGVASILLVSQGELTIACWLIFLAALFDVFDGLAARALGGGTPLGAQLDSLADMVSFGVAPGALLFFGWRIFRWDTGGLHDLPGMDFWSSLDHLQRLDFGWPEAPPLAFALLISIGSAWRLAKFNIDTRQASGFLGLATPANALFWSSILMLWDPARPTWIMGFRSWGDKELDQLIILTQDQWIVGCTVVILVVLMVSELPLPSLKFGGDNRQQNQMVLIGLFSVLSALYIGVFAVPMILAFYLLSPLWGKLIPRKT